MAQGAVATVAAVAEKPARPANECLYQLGVAIKAEECPEEEASVFFCLDLSSGALLAMKQLRRQHDESSGAWTRLHRRLQADIDKMRPFLRSVDARDSRPERTRHIVACHGIEVGHDSLRVFMDYMPGGSLREVVARFGRLGCVAASVYATQALRGVVELHAVGICHGCLTPDHLFVSGDGTLRIGGWATSARARRSRAVTAAAHEHALDLVGVGLAVLLMIVGAGAAAAFLAESALVDAAGLRQALHLADSAWREIDEAFDVAAALADGGGGSDTTPGSDIGGGGGGGGDPSSSFGHARDFVVCCMSGAMDAEALLGHAFLALPQQPQGPQPAPATASALIVADAADAALPDPSSSARSGVSPPHHLLSWMSSPPLQVDDTGVSMVGATIPRELQASAAWAGRGELQVDDSGVRVVVGGGGPAAVASPSPFSVPSRLRVDGGGGGGAMLRLGSVEAGALRSSPSSLPPAIAAARMRLTRGGMGSFASFMSFGSVDHDPTGAQHNASASQYHRQQQHPYAAHPAHHVPAAAAATGSSSAAPPASRPPAAAPSARPSLSPPSSEHSLPQPPPALPRLHHLTSDATSAGAGSVEQQEQEEEEEEGDGDPLLMSDGWGLWDPKMERNRAVGVGSQGAGDRHRGGGNGGVAADRPAAAAAAAEEQEQPGGEAGQRTAAQMLALQRWLSGASAMSGGANMHFRESAESRVSIS